MNNIEMKSDFFQFNKNIYFDDILIT